MEHNFVKLIQLWLLSNILSRFRIALLRPFWCKQLQPSVSVGISPVAPLHVPPSFHTHMPLPSCMSVLHIVSFDLTLLLSPSALHPCSNIVNRFNNTWLGNRELAYHCNWFTIKIWITVKPVNKDHQWGYQKVVFVDRWSLFTNWN